MNTIVIEFCATWIGLFLFNGTGDQTAVWDIDYDTLNELVGPIESNAEWAFCQTSLSNQ